MFRMEIPVRLFSAAHLAILASVPVLAWLLARAGRRVARADHFIRIGLVAGLLACTIAFYARFPLRGESMFPYHLPLELCDVALWLSIACLLTRSRYLFDVAYFWCIAGPAMAMLTPNVTEQSVFLVVQFFVDHGLILVAILYLLWSGQMRPRPGALLKAFLCLNLLTLAVGAFDWIYDADYMFLMRKPPTASLLDLFGPWPWYVLVCEGAATVLFTLLYLPFWRGNRMRERQVAAA